MEIAMTKLERFVSELTDQDLTFVVGGAEPAQNGKSPLIRKRSEIKDSHDRYANIEVTYQ
jgi:hypothetical protein